MLYWFLKILLTIPLKLLYPVKVLGKKNYVKKGGVIQICNHRTMADPIVVALYQRRRVYFLGKIEIFKKFFIRSFLKALGAIPVNRANVGVSTMKTVVKTLKKGKAMLIFPEGRRNTDEQAKMQELKNGIAAFSLMAKVPISPVIMLKSPKIFRKNYIIMGEPIILEEFYKERPTGDVLEKINKIVTDKMQLLQNELQEYYDNRKRKKKLPTMA